MLRHCARPIIFPISNPTDNAEATAANLLHLTGGAVLIFPGVGLGALAVGAPRLTDAAFAAAGDALHRFTEISGRPGEAIYPPLSRLRDVSFHVALAVGTALIAAGVADPLSAGEAERRVREMIWEPVYRPYRPA